MRGHLSPGSLEKSPLKKDVWNFRNWSEETQYRNDILVGYPEARIIQQAQNGGFLSHGGNPQIIFLCLGFSTINQRAIGATSMTTETQCH